MKQVLPGAPPWITRGTVVDPWKRSDDAEAILEPEESDLIWFEVVIPIGAFGATLPDLAGQTSLQELEEERLRFETVRQWMKREGGPKAALRKSPILALWERDRGRLVLLDGHHRMSVAQSQGLCWVTALVGVAALDPAMAVIAEHDK
jgi:hypothetical protein